MAHHIAFLGKNGVGTTTVVSNITAALTEAGFRVLMVGCSPDADSCSQLLDPSVPSAVSHEVSTLPASILKKTVISGFKGAGCVELHGVDTTSGAVSNLKRLHAEGAFSEWKPDFILFDVPGDGSNGTLKAIVDEVGLELLFVITSADLKAVQKANDIFRFLGGYDREYGRSLPLGGLILNNISSSFEEAFANDFAYHTNVRPIGKIPRSATVRQSELYGTTVIEARPKSNQSYYYRRLANQIVDATEVPSSRNQPFPLSTERLSEWRLDWAERINVLENGLVSDGAAI